MATQKDRYLARLLGQLAKKEELERRFAVLHGERSGLPEGPEGKAKNNAEEIESFVKQLNKTSKIRPFHYSHQGSLAYIDSNKAIADLPFHERKLRLWWRHDFLFWRSAYVSSMFSLRNRTLVLSDWLKVKLFGRDVSRESRN